MTRGEMPAFPTRITDKGGMTIREYAAIHIAAGACASEVGDDVWTHAEKFAAFVVLRTDALLAELERRGT